MYDTTTGPLVPDNFLSSQKIFPQERQKDNCKKLDIHRKNSEEKNEKILPVLYDFGNTIIL